MLYKKHTKKGEKDMGDFEKIAERGYIYQATDLERIKSMLYGE